MSELAEFYDINTDTMRLAPCELVEATQAAFRDWHESTGYAPLQNLNRSLGDPVLFETYRLATLAQLHASKPKFDA